MEKEKALIVGKFSALIALLAFVLLPQAGCGDVTISGHKMLTDTSMGSFYIVLGWVLVATCLLAFFSRKISYLIGLGIIGLGSIVLMLLKIKSETGELSEMIEIKYGASITILGLLGTIGSSFLAKKEEKTSSDLEGTKVMPTLKPKIDFDKTRQKFEKWLATVIPKMTTDRIFIFFAASVACLVMALNWLIKIDRLSNMSGGAGFWLGVQFPIWIYGIYWLVKSYKMKVYPFDPKTTSEKG